MQRGYKLRSVACLAVVSLLVGGSIHAQAQMVETPMHRDDPAHERMHPLNSECSGCHTAGRDTQISTASMLTNRQEVLCVRCHSTSMQKSHPSGLMPRDKKSIPTRYPLDWKGYMTCSTCHEVHSDYPGRLRGNVRGRDMCLSCHSQGFFDSRRDDAAHRIAP